jgi:hypothetical protein
VVYHALRRLDSIVCFDNRHRHLRRRVNMNSRFLFLQSSPTRSRSGPKPVTSGEPITQVDFGAAFRFKT